MDLVDLALLEVVVASLPADNIPDDNKPKDTQTGCAAPVDKGVTQQEVLDDCDKD
jgi:hypothetical protein